MHTLSRLPGVAWIQSKGDDLYHPDMALLQRCRIQSLARQAPENHAGLPLHRNTLTCLGIHCDGLSIAQLQLMAASYHRSFV